MTQFDPQSSEYPPGPGEEAAGRTGKAPGRRNRFTRLARQGRTRWVVLGLVVLIGGGAAAAAVAEHHHKERADGRYSAEGRDHRGARRTEGRPEAKKERNSGLGPV